jgi:predicted glycoside hydrolase/deacetylase ChbG (UPF0249 family)
MTPHFLGRLGLTPSDRALVVHADDIGLCESTITALEEAFKRGAVSAASTMPPTRYFAQTARWCRERPQAADMGVHVTLNSEWDYERWKPLTGVAAVGLIDEGGHMWQSATGTYPNADLGAVRRECGVQVQAALDLGIDVTHVDSHQFTLDHPVLIDAYLELGRRFQVPTAITRRRLEDIESMGVSRSEAERYMELVSQADAAGLVAFDKRTFFPLDDLSMGRLEQARRLVGELPAGLSLMLMHPAVDTPQLRKIATDWPARVADYELCRDDGWPRLLASAGVKMVGMRALREAMFGKAMTS